MIDVEIREKRWALKPDGKPEQVSALASQLNINKTLANLLVRRGITTFDQARLFFRPSVTDLHDPFLMTDMDKAVIRLEEAIANFSLW